MNPLLVALVSGFSIGILGSFHCLGMCGPLALSLPIHHLSKANKTFSILSYNFGRAISYATIGVIFGLLGMSFSLFKLQQALTIGAGVLLLLVLLGVQFGKTNFKFIANFSLFIHQKLNQFLHAKQSPLNYLSIGIANGFLPCGLVYVAVIAGMATGYVVNSSLLMFGFGLGTIPMMALTMLFGKFISIPVRQKINKLIPYIMMGVAVLLILRGLNLGIPYISPKMVGEKVNCCHR